MNIQQPENGMPEQAARWVGALNRGGDAERAAFTAWIKASPQHVKEFLLASALDKEAGQTDLSDFDVDDILATATGVSNVVSLGSGRTGQTTAPMSAHRWPWSAGIAATVAAAAGGWWMLAGPGSWQTYATAIGEQRTIELEDGSMIELDPSSRVQVRLTGERRDLNLTAGEALFTVERDANRPFRVTSGDTVVRVLGTQFAVHRRSASVTVSVLEGRVEVNSERILGAGEAIKVPATGPAQARVLTMNEQTAVLRNRSFTFSGDTLAEIAEDFNRYNRTPKIHIEGEQLRMRQYSGVFDADDPQSLADYLVRVAGLSAERAGNTIVIREMR